jgi:hypothetical protein
MFLTDCLPNYVLKQFRVIFMQMESLFQSVLLLDSPWTMYKTPCALEFSYNEVEILMNQVFVSRHNEVSCFYVKQFSFTFDE